MSMTLGPCTSILNQHEGSGAVHRSIWIRHGICPFLLALLACRRPARFSFHCSHFLTDFLTFAGGPWGHDLMAPRGPLRRCWPG
jgi:hypothetical protein